MIFSTAEASHSDISDSNSDVLLLPSDGLMLPRAAKAIPSLATAAASLLWRTSAGGFFFKFLELQTCLKTPSSVVPLAARKCRHQVLRSLPMLHET